MQKPRVEKDAVFLNIPYDAKFERLYLAYIVGLISLDLVPKVTLGIPSGQRRLTRILRLVAGCRYSVHDLSRVELDRNKPCTPRFNMPFELGVCVTWAELNPSQHMWFVLETQERRALKSLSDLNGTDVHIHDGRIEGVMRELCNAFTARGRRPTVPEMMEMYRTLRQRVPEILALTRAHSVYEARIFRELCLSIVALRRAKLNFKAQR